MIAILLISMLCSQAALTAQKDFIKLPPAARFMLDSRLRGWKFAEPSPEVREYFESSRKGESPSLISGDFDGNGRPDYAALVRYGVERNEAGKAIGPRFFLIVFLQKGKGYRMYVIKDPNGEYLCLAKKGTKDYNYEEQKEITYANDAILTGIFEKAGSSYVYENGRFRAFISSD